MNGTPDLKVINTPGRRKQLLDAKYPKDKHPRYIKPEKFDEIYKGTQHAIDTHEWKIVSPEYIGDKPTNNWVSVYTILYNEDLITALLENTEPLEEAKIPTNGGRRAQRQTKVKSKKRANKRRTRSRK
jgi:hypothetical protein